MGPESLLGHFGVGLAESLLSHFWVTLTNAFCVSLELGGRRLHNHRREIIRGFDDKCNPLG